MNATQLSLFGPDRAIEERPDESRRPTKRERFEDYDAFTDKFKTKLTTDDCYTPEAVYKAVLDFVGSLTDLRGREVVRPFYPGGDFTAYEYPANSIVIDNPPFSILTSIIRFYCSHGILFFLFGPGLTLFLAKECDLTYIIADADIVYENGAVVRTGFITNLPSEVRVWCCPQLKRAIADAQKTPNKTKKGFVYPDNIITAATLGKITAHNTELKILKRSCYAVSDCDAAKATGRRLFGGGFLLSDVAAAERAAAERAAAERAAAERAAATRLNLSPRERRIIDMLNKRDHETPVH